MTVPSSITILGGSLDGVIDTHISSYLDSVYGVTHFPV